MKLSFGSSCQDVCPDKLSSKPTQLMLYANMTSFWLSNQIRHQFLHIHTTRWIVYSASFSRKLEGCFWRCLRLSRAILGGILGSSDQVFRLFCPTTNLFNRYNTINANKKECIQRVGCVFTIYIYIWYSGVWRKAVRSLRRAAESCTSSASA